MAAMAICTHAVYADDLPVEYGNCASWDYPILLLDGTPYRPGNTDTLTVALGDTVWAKAVMAVDDSFNASPPCDCDTLEANGGAINTDWWLKAVLYVKDPYPAGRTNEQIANGAFPTCPDTLLGEAGHPVVFTRSGTDGNIMVVGRVYIGTDLLGNRADSVRVPVNVTYTPANTGDRALVSK